MNKKRVVVLGVSMLFLICVSSCLAWSKAMLTPEKPSVSARGGTYNEEILVELSTTCGNEIYYTTDGSVPTYQSLKYEEPIRIVDRSGEDNRYRNARNFMTDWLEYEPDTTPVEKGTVIRAISISRWGNSSDIVTETYFIGREELKEEGSYMISLAADPEELFGEDGIYVTGKEYDEWYLAGKPEMAVVPAPNFVSKAERKVNLEIFEMGEQVLNQYAGIRIRGASSRFLPLKSFNLFSREEYSGSNVFDINLFENVKTHSVMLKPFSIYVMIPDILSDRDVSVQKSRKVKVYVNGEFWYETYMMERYDQEYFKEYYGVKEAAIIDNETDIAYKKEGTPEKYEDLMEWIQNTDFTDPRQWELVKEKIDVQSYIDFIAANVYLCNGDVRFDWNHKRWFSENTGASPYEDGRIRWVIYDLDEMGSPDVNTFSCKQYGNAAINEGPLYQAFYVNEEYRKQFVLSFMDIANNNLSPEKVEPVLNAYGLDLSWNNNFFLERYDYITAYLKEAFELSGTLEPVEISVNDESGDSITVNTSTLRFSDGLWNGKYYTDYPITITANPDAGYQFAGWEGDLEAEAETITVSVEDGLALEAVFERK